MATLYAPRAGMGRQTVSNRKRKQPDQFDRELPVGCIPYEVLGKPKHTAHQLVQGRKRKVKCYPCTDENKHMVINANDLVIAYSTESIRSQRNGHGLRPDLPEVFAALNGMPINQETNFIGVCIDHFSPSRGSKPVLVVCRGKITVTNTGESTIPFGYPVVYKLPDLEETDTNAVIAGRIRVKTVALLAPPVNGNDLVMDVRTELNNEIEKKDNYESGDQVAMEGRGTKGLVGSSGGLNAKQIYTKIKQVHNIEAKSWGTNKEQIARFQTTEMYDFYEELKKAKAKTNEVIWMELSRKFRLDMAGILDRVMIQERFNEKLWVREVILHYLLFDTISIDWLEESIKTPTKAKAFKFWRQQAVVNCFTEAMSCVSTAQNWSEIRRRKNVVGIALNAPDPGDALQLLLGN